MLQAGASAAATNFSRWSAFLAWAADKSAERVALLARAELPDLALFSGILTSGAIPKAPGVEGALPPQSSLTSRVALQVNCASIHTESCLCR